MSEQTCKQCTHFRQHYVVNSQRCTPVCCGHCTYPGIKRRTPTSPACAYFCRQEEEDLPDRAEVIDFLTKDILEHILSLELPPVVTAEDEGLD